MEALGTAEEESQKTVASKGELWRYRLSAARREGRHWSTEESSHYNQAVLGRVDHHT